MLTLLVSAPDVDALRRFLGELPSLKPAAERTGCDVIVLDDDRRFTDLTQIEGD